MRSLERGDVQIAFRGKFQRHLDSLEQRPWIADGFCESGRRLVCLTRAMRPTREQRLHNKAYTL